MDSEDLIHAARFGIEIEDALNSPVIRYVLIRMSERVDEAKEALATLDPETKAPEIRQRQAEIARFKAMQEDIEKAVNDGRQAHRMLTDQERVDDA